MDRSFFLGLAASGLRMPIGAHLVLHEHPNPAAVLTDGARLGRVVEEAARRFRTPLAFPLMDLSLEKESLLLARGVAPAEVDAYHFDEPPELNVEFAFTPKMAAVCGGIHYIANQTRLLPVGMAIGPFSLMTKLISDPIAPVYLAGAGATPEDEPEVALVGRLLALALQTIQKYVEAQMAAGAQAIILCEPAANKVFFSPNQLAQSYSVFDRYVMKLNLALRDQLGARGADLIFHDCGELVDGMVTRFGRLDPAVISLGSSRSLWHDAGLLPKTTVLYGNLPTKQFYSDELMPVEKVRELADEITRQMRASGHPFILGSECDVLSVPDRAESIRRKVEAFLEIP